MLYPGNDYGLRNGRGDLRRVLVNMMHVSYGLSLLSVDLRMHHKAIEHRYSLRSVAPAWARFDLGS